MDYKLIVDYINQAYPKMKQELIEYVNGVLFEKDVYDLMEIQNRAGEPIDIQFAANCIIDREADMMYVY